MGGRADPGCGAHPADGASRPGSVSSWSLEAPQTLVVCKAGGRSARAAAYLAQQGYDVVNLVDGMMGWERAGRPMVADGDQPPTVV
ncbi:rhodanese-like domain-containing protein [Nocardioides convexus]|uniref:rhodanese-like domain-containing protein n=1 Tax=Nocardioides convexus TaxID=2712224 RepID=UPI0031011E58